MLSAHDLQEDAELIADALDEARAELKLACDPRCDDCIQLRRFIAAMFFAHRREDRRAA